MSDVRDNRASEFGGRPGPVQPPPHALTPAETARLERALNPADANDSVEAARVREGGSPSA